MSTRVERKIEHFQAQLERFIAYRYITSGLVPVTGREVAEYVMLSGMWRPCLPGDLRAWLTRYMRQRLLVDDQPCGDPPELRWVVRPLGHNEALLDHVAIIAECVGEAASAEPPSADTMEGAQ